MKLRVYERIIFAAMSSKGKRSVVIRLGQIAFKTGHLSERLKTLSKHPAIATLFKG